MLDMLESPRSHDNEFARPGMHCIFSVRLNNPLIVLR